MKIAVLTTNTNNLAPILDSLVGLGYDVTRFVYDEMTHDEHEQLPSLVEAINPDWVLYVGAIVEHHGRPVPRVEILARIGAKRLLVHFCCDGAEPYWWRQLQEYYDHGRFALQVNVDGVRNGPIGDRGFTTLCPVDAAKFRDLPWEERALWCGFSGGAHAGRPDIVYPLRDRDLLTYRARDPSGSYASYRNFIEQCRVGLNVASTGGGIGGPHVKHRAGGELPAAGCLVLETKGSPLADWFDAGEDYLEYDGVEGAERQIIWAREHADVARAMAQRMRAKVIERHSPTAFWSQVTERLGLGPALRRAPEAPHRHWAPNYTPPPFGAAPLPPVAVSRLPTPGPGAPPPRLLQTYHRVNIVAMNGHVFTVPQGLGPVDLDRIDLSRYPMIKRFADAPSAHRSLVGRR